MSPDPLRIKLGMLVFQGYTRKRLSPFIILALFPAGPLLLAHHKKGRLWVFFFARVLSE